MKITGSAIAVLSTHHAAETAVKRLSAEGFETKYLSVVGRGYQSEEAVIGFYDAGRNGKVWGVRGEFWGTLWGGFSGGIFLKSPVFGHLIILGYLATTVISVIEAAEENPAILRGLSALGTALCYVGIPKDSALYYEAAMKGDEFLVMAHGSAATMINAKIILGKLIPSCLGMHVGGEQVDATARTG